MFSSRLATALVLALMLASPPTRASEPPQTEESLLEQLEGATGSSSSGYRVAYELGRLRSASGLRKIAEKGDHQLVAGFNHGMSLAERDRGGALPPDLEKVVVDRFEDPRVGRDLEMLLMNGRYRSRALFDLMVKRVSDPGLKPFDRGQSAYRLTRTDLPVEREVQALLGTPAFSQAESGRLELAQFLAERHYDPVVPILQQMLLQGSDAEAYGAVRSLSELGTPESTAAVIGYLRGAGGRDAGRAREVLNHLLAELAKLPPEKPIDFAALRTVLPEKMEAATAFAYVQLLQRRHEKSGTKELLAIVARGPSDQAFHAAFQALLALGDVAAWTSAAAELDNQRAANRMDPSTYQRLSKSLQERIADPAGASLRDTAKWEEDREREAIQARKRKLDEATRDLQRLLDSDPRRYAAEYAKHLEAVEALLRDVSKTSVAEPIRRELAQGHLQLGHVFRFDLGEPREALAEYEKARTFEQRGSFSPSRLAVADLAQFALGDRDAAIRAYEEALSSDAPDAVNLQDLETRKLVEWWQKWVGREVLFLREGRRFSGPVTREDVPGVYMSAVFGAFAPAHPALRKVLWKEGKRSPEAIREALRSLPPSRILLLQSISLLPYLGSDELLRFLERHDPSRVWSGAILVTCLQATARSGHHEFQILPSKEDFGSDLQNPFPAAAKAFVAATGIDLPLAPDPRLETPEETWALFLRSLKSGDRNSALQCFGLRMRMTVEALFARMSDAELAKMGSDFGADLKPAEKGNDALGRQYVASGGKGEKASVAIDFENDDGEWRIRFM